MTVIGLVTEFDGLTQIDATAAVDRRRLAAGTAHRRRRPWAAAVPDAPTRGREAHEGELLGADRRASR